MKTSLLTLGGLLAVAVTLSTYAGSPDWVRDFEEAKRLAAEKNVPILADFSGSDWCGWCVRLDREVFSQPAFKEFAKEGVVLFLADFPSSKPQPAAEAKQNRELAERYGVSMFPTVVLLDKDGAALAQAGYRPGGADAYVAHLKELIRDAASGVDGV